MYFGGDRVCQRGRLGAGSGISTTAVGVEWTVAEGSLSLFGAIRLGSINARCGG